MGNFFEHFQKQNEALNSNFNDNDKVEYPTVKAEEVFLSKKTPQHLLRLLPSAEMLRGESFEFATPIRKIFFKNPVANAKPANVNLRLAPNPDQNSELEQCLSRWADEGKLTGAYGPIRPNSSYLVYVVPHTVDHTGVNYVPVTDDDGYPKVQVLELPKSAYQAVASKLGDSRLCPRNAQGALLDLSFLSLESSYLVSITKAKPGEKAHTVEVYANVPLGNITGQVEHKLEDLSVLQYTTETLNPGLVEHIMSTIDERPRRDGKGDSNVAPNVPAPAPVAPQAPVMPQAPVAPQAPVMPQAPVAPVAPPVPQAPVAPVAPPVPQAPVAPAQQVAPPIPQAPVAPPAPQAVAPQAPVAPAPVAPQAPVAPAVPATPAPATPQAGEDINDLMASLQQSLHQG